MGHGLSVIGPTPSFPIFYFPHFIFSFPPSRLKIPPLCIGSILPPILIPSVVKNTMVQSIQTNLTTDGTDTIWIKDKRPMALVPSCPHPDPIRGQKCLERSGSGFPDFLLSPFHLFRPALVQAAFAAYSLSVKLKFKDQMAVPSASVTST
jgi:hypothetical protein